MQVCLDKKLTTAEELRAAAEQMEARPGLNLGARLTVKAWTDPAFKVRATVEPRRAQEYDEVSPGLNLGVKLTVQVLTDPAVKAEAGPSMQMQPSH